MSPAVSIDPRRETGYRVGATPQVLHQIREPGISFSVWRRSLPRDATRALRTWIADHTLEIDRVLPTGELDLASLPELASLPAEAEVLDDVRQLAERLRGISDCKKLRIALGVKCTDACRKFHTDNVRLRMITTYVGPGTEWLPNAAVDRRVLQHPPDCPCDANREIVRDARAVQHARAGDVLLLKGELYGSAPGAVHRSPPIAERGLKRLVLALTTVD